MNLLNRKLLRAKPWAIAGMMLSSLWITEAQAAREILVMDEHCTINVLNRTVQVAEDGFFTLDNVPSNMGQIKARATCLQEGKLVTAESDYFSVPTNGRISVGEFFKADGNSVPVELQITNEAPITLKKEGATERLSVIARYRNGNTRDVTAVVNGVNYTPSNPDVIRVDANGLITALRSGSSLITARKDGVVGIVRVNVVTSGDSDNDGIPDDIEMANGMNPRDPVDAFEDVDNDGLSALEEYQQGTDINNDDSDDDGIKDGEELITGEDGFITNPMIADTDGDGLTDGQEVEAGSDPTDVNSANYAKLLVSIAATPGEAVLFYNTLDGESSVQLKVTGTLLDGTEVDLTRTTRQTTYQSSDNLIANFGVEDGRIYAGQDGIATIAVNNNGFTTNVQITVSSFAPVNISSLVFDYKTNLKKLHHDGDSVYIASDLGLHVIDISDLENPVESHRIEIEGGVSDVDVAAGQIYVFTADKILIYDQQAIELKSELILPAAFADVVITEEGMVVATAEGFHVYNLANPVAPRLIASEIINKAVKSVDLDGSLLVAVVGSDLLTFSAGSLNTITQLSQFTLLTAGQVELYGEFAFVSSATGSNSVDFHSIVNLTNAVEPKEVLVNPGFNAIDLVHAGNYVLYANNFGATNAIPVVNVKQVNTPAYQALIRFSTSGGCISIDADLAFVFCNDYRTFRIVQYRKLQDLSGIAPKITWQTPEYTSTLSQRRSYRVTADVTDDVEVAVVNFYANNELVFSDISEPYTFIHKVPFDATSQTYRIDAMDLASNKSSSGDVVFSVVPTGANEEDWKDVDYDYFDEDFLALNIEMDNSRFVAPHKLETIENFVAKGGQEVTVFVDELNVGGDLIIEANTTLIVKSENGVNINGNLILKEGARLTVPSTIENNYVVLELDVAGDVILLDGAQINLDGKGYNLRNTGGPEGELDSTANGHWACHGGVRFKSNNRDCAYGRYDNPIFAGSAGINNGTSYPAIGGGVLKLKANQLDLAANSQISAEGVLGYSAGASGGSIQLHVNTLRGTGTISVAGANGVNTANASGSGGRLALFLQSDANFSGQYSIAGAHNSGSGTFFKKYSDQQWGELTVDGDNSNELRYSTPLPNIGRHVITVVEMVEPGLWKLSVDGTPWDISNEDTQQGHIGRQLILDANLASSKRYQVVSNTVNEIIISTDDDISGVIGNILSGVYVFDKIQLVESGWLDVGSDQLIVLDIENSRISKGTLSFDYSVAQPLIENAITYGGSIFSKSELILGDLNLELAESSTLSQAHIRAPSMKVLGDVSLTTTKNRQDPFNTLPRRLDLSLPEGLNVTGNALFDDFIVQAGRMEVLEGKYLFPMHIEAAGDVSILGRAHISADGAGYNFSYYFPDFSQAGSSSHAGLIRKDNNPVYGDYWFARFPGRGIDTYSQGGGVVYLKASNINNMGKISANGTTSFRSSNAAAGGSVHIEAASFSGGGRVYANAATNTGYEQSSGGRISVATLDNQFTGEYLARSVTGAASTRGSGAGTIFLKNPTEKYGHLIVSGSGLKELKSTPIKNIGEHSIIAVYSTIPGEWNIRVEGEPWQESNDDLDYGLTGLEVLLGSRNPSNSRYRIKSNTVNTLTVVSEEDLSVYKNQSLVGIHTFKKLTVSGTASLDLGKDVIEVLDLDSSGVNYGASVYAGSALISDIQLASAGGHLVIDSWDVVPDVEVDIGNGQVTLVDDMTLNSFILNSGNLSFGNLSAQSVTINNSNLSIEHSLSANNLQLNSATLDLNAISTVALNAVDSNVTAYTINATDISLNKGLVVADDINAINDISLVDGAIISTFSQETYPNKLYVLDVTSGASISIDETSRIDVSGKGYLDLGYGFDSHYRSMHTGLITENEGYFFGSLKRPSVHGGGNNGGGVLRLETNVLELDGKLLANANYYSYSQRGAGGSILIEVEKISGSAAALISATGYSPYSASYGSTGGRISVIADQADYFGSFNTSSNDKAASGTTFLTLRNESFPDLIINNKDVVTIPASTLMPAVGVHEIIDAIQLSSGLWQLRFETANWKVANTEDILDLSNVYVDLDISTPDSEHEYIIERNSSQSIYVRTMNDLTPFIGKSIRGVHKFRKLVVKGGASIDFGADEFRVSNLSESEVSSGSSIYTGYIQSSLMPIIKDSGELHFKNSDLSGDWIIDFLPAEGRLVVDGDLLLDNLYHTSGNLEITGQLNLVGDLSVQGVNSIKIGELNINDVSISSTNSVDVNALNCSSLNISGVAQYLGKSIQCQSADALNTVLKIENIDIENDINLLGSTIVTSYSQEKDKKPVRLVIDVKGTLFIDELASINQTGNGYRYLSNLKSDDELHIANRYGANGGIPSLSASPSSYSNKPVGRFERPFYPAPGVSGDYLTSGGSIDILAKKLQLDGKIISDGKLAWRRDSGAGGSIYLESPEITLGAQALISAQSVIPYDTYKHTGSGGRIALITSNFSGNETQILANASTSSASGSGTVFIKDPAEKLGSLIVNNGTTLAARGSTPLRSVGKHQVHSIYSKGSGWEVLVEGTPWASTELPWSGSSIDGLWVTFGHGIGNRKYRIESNNKSGFYLETDDDLSQYSGGFVQGVHRFKSLVVTAGASLDLGADLLEITDIDNSEISGSASVKSGFNNLNILQRILSSGSTINITDNISSVELTLSDGDFEFELPISTSSIININNAKLSAPSISTNNLVLENSTVLVDQINASDMTLSLGSGVVSNNISVLNNLQVLTNSYIRAKEPNSISKELYPLNITVGGVFTVDATSFIDANRKGFPYRYRTPGFVESSAYSSGHAGLALNKTEGTFGRFDSPMFAGSAGYDQHGGGIININTHSMELEGSISANGVWSRYASAGGSITLETNIFTGNGSVSADGGDGDHYSSSYYSGGGGRIALFISDDTNFTGTLSANGGNKGDVQAAGAGTVYKQYHGNKYGQLSITNREIDAQVNSTPIHGIGKKTIDRIERLNNRIVRIYLLATNYEVLRSGLVQSLAGLEFNIASEQGVLKQYAIYDNGLNYVDVEDYDELVIEEGSFVQGIFKFEALDVSAGAFVDWQENLFEVVGPVDSVEDFDGDYLSDVDEVNIGTNNTVKDTDGDGLWDGIEFVIGSDPLVNQELDLTPYIHSIEVHSSLNNGRLDLEIQASNFELSYSLVLKVGDDYYSQTIEGDLLNQLIISSSDLDVVVIDSNSLFRGVSAGNSQISVSLYGYETSYVVNISDITNHVYLEEIVTFDSDRTSNTITLNGSQLIAQDSELIINGDLIVSVADVEGASRNNIVTLNNLIVNGNLIIDGAELMVNAPEISISGDVSLINGASLTTDIADIDSKLIHSINLVAGGVLIIDENSEINADGKGYSKGFWSGPDFSFKTRQGCYGGIPLGMTDCVYGRYQKAQLAGSGGYNANGGGIVVIEAGKIHIDGSINSNSGVEGSSSYGSTGGAGGGIHLETAHLTGGGNINASAQGPSYYHVGAGGRVSIYAAKNEFSGRYLASGGFSKHNYMTGAGTVYLQQGNNVSGTLLVENPNGNNANVIHKGTPIRTIGRHVIQHISQTDNGNWYIQVEGSPWKMTNQDLGWGVQGIDIDLDSTNSTNSIYEVISNTENTLLIKTPDDLSIYENKELLGVHTLDKLIIRGMASVDFGEDRLVILDPLNSEIDEFSELYVGEFDEITEQSFIFSSHERIKGTIVLSNNLLSGDVVLERPLGQKLVLIEPVNVRSLHIKSGNVDFTGGLSVEMSMTLSGSAEVYLSNSLNLESLILEESSIFKVEGVSAKDIALGDASKLITEKILAENLFLSGSSQLTTEAAIISNKQVNALDIKVNKLIISENSSINVDTKGYPLGSWSGPDFSAKTRHGCHGGIRSTSVDCTYGRYQKAKFAGSGGYSEGGGIVTIEAVNTHVDGVISANSGINGNTSFDNIGGAGGGVHLQTERLTGAGSFNASAMGPSYYYRGAGGRISVYATYNEFRGAYLASGARSKSGYVTGAGTIYLQQEKNTPGTLIVKNPYESNSGVLHKGTPIRTVGRHAINHIFQVAVDEWRLEVAGSPWKATNEALDWGIQGIEVDLDASDPANSVYEIISNTENTILIQTSDDLTAYAGKELLGVHTLDKLIVRGKASVDFGEDRLVILDPLNSEISEFSELFVGELNSEAWSVFAANTYKNGALLAEYYEALESNEILKTRKLSPGIAINNVNIPVSNSNKLKVRWTGLLQIPQDGLYSFAVDSQGATKIWLDSTSVLATTCCGYAVSSAIDLKAGYREVTIEYENDEGLLDIDLLWVMPGEIEQPITSNYLSYRAPGINGELKLAGSVSFDDEELFSNSGHTVEFSQAVTANSLIVSGGDFVFESDLIISQVLNVLGDSTVLVNGDFSAGQINLSESAKLIVNRTDASQVELSDSAVLETKSVDTTNLHLIDESTLTGMSANIEDKEIYPLDVRADNIFIATGARITMDAKGYPSNSWSGPDFEQSVSGGCHAGLIYENQTGCVYGGYELARFAGSSGTSNGNGHGNGGGLIQITGQVITLNGTVSANGEKGGGTGAAKQSSGAGGGIHISTDELNGSGNIEANGASYSTAYVSSSGGRASIYALQNNYVGQYSAKGAVGRYQISGAGTVYLKSNDDDNGILIVDNIAAVNGKPLGVTPVRHVGNHQITGVYPESSGEWRIQVDGADWKASTANFGYGLQGLLVSLPEAGLEELRVVSNTENTLLIQSNADLQGIVGQSLFGVQKLRKIIVKGAAKVDFGEDHLIIEDLENSSLDQVSELITGNTTGL